MNNIDVYLDLAGNPIRMGAARIDERGGRVVRCEFTYDSDYLARPDKLALDPSAPLTGDRWVTADLPRGLADAGPDGWGRSLLLRANRGRAMSTADLLLAVDDTSRIGALRLRAGNGWEGSSDTRVPALVHLAELLQAAGEVESGTDATEAVRRLVGAGTASLGGMRPKASVFNESGKLSLAKFSSRRDDISVIAWEKVCLDLAAKAGIPVPGNRLLRIGEEPVLLLDRFDRTADGHRLPYLSAFAITDAPDPASGDYLEIGEALTDLDTADLPGTLRQLWRRAAFNVAMCNTDDHLKNHAILWRAEGWSLSPAFDITPNPVGGTPRATQIDGEDLPGGEARGLARLGEEFGIAPSERHAILTSILTATVGWRTHARGLSISTAEITKLERPLDDSRQRLVGLTEKYT